VALVVAEQPADALRHPVALLADVEQQRPPSRPPEDQAGAQPAAPPPTTTQSHSEVIARCSPIVAERVNLDAWVYLHR
jgi:hypothetical protein